MGKLQFITLETKPSARMCYRFYPHTSPVSPLLVVFLNGMILPQMAWSRIISKIRELRQDDNLPGILTYDRFGQGETTDRDPLDEKASDPSHGHDFTAAVEDLHQLLTQIARDKMGFRYLDDLRIVFVGFSIGCALARLYADKYLGTVSGMMLLDHFLTDSDIESIFPDPDEIDFDCTDLPANMTPDDLRRARAGVKKFFHPSVGSNEGLSRKNLGLILPHSDSPKLYGPDGLGLFVTIVGHDPVAFGAEGEKLMGRPKELSMKYLSPYWHNYNRGLIKITDKDKVEGPLMAPGLGTFIHRDNPGFIAQLLDELLSKIM